MALAAIPWALLGAFNVIKGEFFSRDIQDKWQVARINPWPWWAWLLMSIAIVLAVTLEGAYRVVRNRERDNGLLAKKIAELTEAESKARAEFLRRSTEIIGLGQDLQKAQTSIVEKDKSLSHLNAVLEKRSQEMVDAVNASAFKQKTINELREEVKGLQNSLKQANAQIESLKRPSDCPIVSIFQWAAIEQGPIELVPHGFYLNNSGQKSAYEVTISSFKIGDRTAFAPSGPWNEIIGNRGGNGQIPVALGGLADTQGKWNLLLAFNAASEAKDGNTAPHGRPKFSVPVHVFYRDHRDLWYESVVEVVFLPPQSGVRAGFEFKFVRQGFFGITRPINIEGTQ